jgi:predicted nucleic acid-binding protein
MIAAVCAWHEHHAAATAEIEARLSRGERLMIPAHALAETYAVLTRFPAPNRLSTADAWSLIEANFIHAEQVTALSGHAYVRLLGRLAANNLGGGRTYDAIIAECSERGKSDVILTFNPRHFASLVAGTAVVEPSAVPRP